jgi:antagonist of KipI
VEGHWRIDPRIVPAYSANPLVRAIAGAQAKEFASRFWTEEFRISPQSDRMGLRLVGTKLERTDADDRLSSGVAPGTIQVPPDGQPIVLMADAQTIGGYPQIADVARVDLPLLAQLRPGDTVRFNEITLEEAQRLALAQERTIGMLREGLAQKLH